MSEPAPDPPARRPGGAQIIPRPAAWTPGGLDAPAAHPLSITVDDIEEILADSPPGQPIVPTFPDARASAVLIALADGEEGAEVLLTRRSRHMRNHKGEISFPGGRMDPGETPAQTALREAHEEVGLDPSLVTLFAELDHLSTVVSRSHIVPLVGRLPRIIPLGPASPEVERVFWLPLGELVRPDTYHSERWGRSPTDRLLHFFELEDETVWGATAFMLVDLLSRIAAA
jgi:mutator protein MutT